ISMRPVKVKAYHRAISQPNERPVTNTCQVIQQDITGLVPLKNAILDAVKKGEANRIGRLFFACCRTLDRFGTSFATGKPIPFQCPGGLAVNQHNRIVPVDAEIRLRGPLNSAPVAKQLFSAWFGATNGDSSTDRKEASRRHAQALLLYFRHLIGAAQN